MHRRRVKRLSEECPHTAALIKSFEAPGATGHLLALPSEPGLRIKPKDFLGILSHQFGLSSISRPLTCFCAQDHDGDPDKHPGPLEPNDRASFVHLTICKHLGGGIATHDTVVAFTHKLMNSIPGVTARREVSNEVEHHRCDLIAHDDQYPNGLVLDVSIGQQLSDSYLKKAKTEPRAAAAEREREKIKEWVEPCRKAEYEFAPMGFQWPGGQGASCEATLRRLATLADIASPYEPVNWAAPTRYKYWSQRYGIIIARGVARSGAKLQRHLESSESSRVPDPAALRPPASSSPSSSSSAP